jgi:hypothetical protein
MFFGTHRTAFLEFLRNLTPQVLFLSCALILFERIDVSILRFDYQSLKRVLPPFLAFLVFLGSFIANSTQLLEKFMDSPESLRSEVLLIRGSRLSNIIKTKRLFFAAWRLNKSAFWQIAVVFLFVQTGAIAVAVVAIKSIISKG